MRIVLDTNQLVWALARPPELATFVMAWAASRFTVVCSEELFDEYEHVLSRAYIHKIIYPESLRSFRDYLVDDMELIELTPFSALCRDPDDDKVVATAIQGEVDYLLTADEDILAPNILRVLEQIGIQAITIDEFIIKLDP